MGLPRTVEIFGKTYRIEQKGLGEKQLHGDIGHKPPLITIDKSDSPHEKIHTLLHEMGHGLSRRLGIYQVIDDQLEEIISEGFATMITENFNLTPKKK